MPHSQSRKDRKMWDRWRAFPGVYDKLGMLVLVFMIIASPDWSAFSQGTKEVDFFCLIWCQLPQNCLDSRAVPSAPFARYWLLIATHIDDTLWHLFWMTFVC